MGDIQPTALKPLHIKANGYNQRTQPETETKTRKKYKKRNAHNVARVKPQKDHFQLETTKKRQLYQKFHTKTHNPNPQPQA